MDGKYIKNKKYLDVLGDLQIGYVDNFLRHPESLKLYVNHTFPMYESPDKFISFLVGGTFNNSEIEKGLGKLSIIMDDFDVSSKQEKKDLEGLVGFYNYFSLVNYKNSGCDLFELRDAIGYEIKKINFMSGDYGVAQIGYDLDMLESIVDISRDILKDNIEIIAGGDLLGSTLIGDNLITICDSFPDVYRLLDEKGDRIVNYMKKRI